MIKNSWTVACQRALIDRESNLLTIVDVLEELTLDADSKGQAPEFPAVAPLPFAVVSFWLREDPDTATEGIARVEIVGPNGEAIGQADGPINLRDHETFRTIMRMAGFPVVGPGTHRIRVSHIIGESVIQDWDFPVRIKLVGFDAPTGEAIVGA